MHELGLCIRAFPYPCRRAGLCFMHLLCLFFVLLGYFVNHYANRAQTFQEIALHCTSSVVLASNRQETFDLFAAQEHQAHTVQASFCRSEISEPYCQSNGAVEFQADPMEVPLLSSFEQSDGHLLRSMREALGRGFGWFLPACSASRSSRTRTEFLHTVAGRSTLEPAFMERWQRNFTVASKLSIADAQGSEAAKEQREKQRKERQGQGQVTVPGPPIARSSLEYSNTPSTAAASTAAPTQAEAQLRTIVAALKKNETNLPAELQSLLHENAKVQSQDMTKVLHSAVSKLGKAKKTLQDARAARLNLHNVWRSYLAASVDKWHQFCKDFEDQDSELAQQVQNATEAVKTAHRKDWRHPRRKPKRSSRWRAMANRRWLWKSRTRRRKKSSTAKVRCSKRA